MTRSRSSRDPLSLIGRVVRANGLWQPLFRQMEAEGRILHRNWSLYDTAHAVFRPKHMTPEELEDGYSWLYERLYSHGSIWKRRPEDLRAVVPYLGMSYLYKRSNAFWPLLIRSRLTHAAWRPLVEMTRLRHVRFRRALAARPLAEAAVAAVTPRKTGLPVYAGV